MATNSASHCPLHTGTSYDDGLVAMFGGEAATGFQGNEKVVSVKEWTKLAVDSITCVSSGPDANSISNHTVTDEKLSQFISSDAYLRSALKIAHCLASEICEAESYAAQLSQTNSRNSINNGISRNRCNNEDPISFSVRPFDLPVPNSQWSDRIRIFLTRDFSSSIEERDLQPLPFSPDKKSSSEAEDLQAVLNSVILGESFLEEDLTDVFEEDDRAKENGTSSANSFSFQNVKKAEFLAPSNDIYGGRGALVDKARRIYSLGLVFYELFSGGQIPFELMSKTSSQNDNINRNDSNGTLNANFDPLPSTVENSNFTDLMSSLDIIREFGEDASDGQGENQDNRKKSRSYSSNQENLNMFTVSVEPLRMLKLPRPLCDLLENMIDCSNGDLCGDRAYQNMADVRNDLMLMIEKPAQFLREIDLERLAIDGLQLKDTVFGREDEFSSLVCSYRRAISGKSEMSIISGPSGTGKSVLAGRLGRFVTSNNGMFISGKFDQLQQSKPFLAVASAFNEYCDVIVSSGSSSHSMAIASKLRMALGQEVFHLVKIIPKLRSIIGHSTMENSLNEEQDCVDAGKRIEYLICQFVAIISSSSAVPITLFLDDLQWSDDASIGVIKQLQLMSSSSDLGKQFFFLGCCRGNEMDQDHKIWSMISGLRQFGVTTTIIELSCMDHDTINSMVSEVLCLSPRLTRSLSDILYKKTKGNPLFFCQMMLSWSKDGLLNLSLSRRRWEWDEEKIQSTKLPDNVATFFTGTICRLPKPVQSALCTLSCFGATVSAKLMLCLEQALDTPLLQSLDAAVAEGLLIKSNAAYSFAHDNVQSAAYNIMKPEERCLYHFQYGLALCSSPYFSEDDEIIFIAVDQINRGGPSAVAQASQAATIADLNLMAGRKAVGLSDFKSAFSFFDHGISFLRKNHWKEHYDLSLQLFDGAAKCSFFIGDNVNLKLLSEQIFTFAKTFQDKLNVMYFTVCALSYASRLPESVEKAMWILSQLGEDIPDSLSENDTEMQVAQAKAMLNQIPDNELMNYKRMTNPSKKMAMKFLARLETSLMLIKPELQPFVTVKLVQLSLTHGMSSVSPVGFAQFGALLARLGNIAEGYRYAKIAKKLVETLGSREVAGEVILVATHIMWYVEPMQPTNDFFREGFIAAMAAGDVINAMTNNVYYSTCSLWIGTTLPVVKKNLENCASLLEQQKNLTFLTNVLPMMRNVARLIGSDDTNNFDEMVNETSIEQTLQNPFQQATSNFNKMYISFIFREFDATKSVAEAYFQLYLKTWTLVSVFSARSFISALVCYWIYRQTGDAIWAQRGQEKKKSLHKWAKSSQWNFANKLFLVEAEEQYGNNDLEKAKDSYNKAILTARAHKFIHEEALACELAGYFHLSTGEKNNAVNYFTQAHEKYHLWGAFAKASKLYEFMQSEFGFMERVLTPSELALPQQNIGGQSARKRTHFIVKS